MIIESAEKVDKNKMENDTIKFIENDTIRKMIMIIPQKLHEITQ